LEKTASLGEVKIITHYIENPSPSMVLKAKEKIKLVADTINLKIN